MSTRKNMPKSLTILWDLIKEGHKYYRHEKALLQVDTKSFIQEGHHHIH